MRTSLASLAALGVCLACSVSHVSAGSGDESDPDLIAAWSFEEGEGDVAVDSIAGIELLRMGASWDPDGKQGATLSYDGIDDYLELDQPGELLDLGTGEFTLSAWIKNRSFGLASGGQHQMVLGRGIGNPPQPGYRVYFQWTDYHKHVLTAEIADGTDSSGLSPQKVGFFAERANEWIFVAVTREGSVLSCYVDGELFNVATNAIEGDIDVEGDLNDKFRIGALPYQALWPFDGWIDEVKVYRRALSREELAEQLTR